MTLFDAIQSILITSPKMDFYDAAEQAYAALQVDPGTVKPLVIDNCDDAIVGSVVTHDGQMLVVYDYEKLLGVFVEQFDDEDAALEWVSFNIIGAHMGPGTPLIMYPGDRDVVDNCADNFCEE